MWHTPNGTRHLVGQEAELVREALGMMVDHLSDFADGHLQDPLDRWPYGVELFDSLTWTQQLALLNQVARHLLTETPEPLPLTAVTESAVGAIFAHIQQQVEIELDDQRLDGDVLDEFSDLPSWRERILAAYGETLSEDEREELAAEGFELPAADATELSEWESLIESLADRILWDRDYEMGALLLDAEPGKAALLKRHLGIEDDYYTELSPDVRERQVRPLLNQVKAITHAKPR